jgi:hypothetical protein
VLSDHCATEAWRSPFPSYAFRGVLLAAGLLAPTLDAHAAPKFTTLYTFTPGTSSGWRPGGELAIDQRGWIYGTTEAGGRACPNSQNSCGGTVYGLREPSGGTAPWTLTTLHAFPGGVHGASPRAGVIRSRKGVLYGSTRYGGKLDCTWEPHGWGCGTLFQISPPTPAKPGWTKETLHRFRGGTDGRFPETPLDRTVQGTLHGVTAEGGKFDNGLAFSVTFDAAAGGRPDFASTDRSGGPRLQTIYNFTASTRGNEPTYVEGCGENASNDDESGQCLCDYGVAAGGDGNECCAPNDDPGGCFPDEPTSLADISVRRLDQSPLVRRAPSPGSMYGVAREGGDDDCVLSSLGCGLVYMLRPPAPEQTMWRQAVLHSFVGGAHGAFPNAGLTIGADGSLYGSTSKGGIACAVDADGCGIVFRLSPPVPPSSIWKKTILYRFRGGMDGALPVGGLALDDEGALYGATRYGGGCGSRFDGCGAVYKLIPPVPPATAWSRQILHRFQDSGDGYWPNGGVLLAAGNVLYGTTSVSVFRIAP